MRAIITTFMLAVALPCSGLAADKPVASAETGASQEGIEAAREFARVSGMWQAILNEVSDLGSVVVDSLRQDTPDMRADQAADIRQVVNARFEAEQDDLLNSVAGVLASHLATADLQALTAYFASTPGRAQAEMIAQGRENDRGRDERACFWPCRLNSARKWKPSERARPPSNWLAAQPRFIERGERSFQPVW